MARRNRNFSRLASNLNENGRLKTAAFDESLALGGSVKAYALATDLPLSNNNTGDQALVTETNRLYVWNGSGWYSIAIVNEGPTITASGAGTYELDQDGTPTVITLNATDPEGFDLTWSYAVTSGSLEDTTVTQADNVFTITPGTVDATFGLTFTVSDGSNVVTDVNSFTLSFAVPVTDWSNATKSFQTAATGFTNSYGAQTHVLSTDRVSYYDSQTISSFTEAGVVFIYSDTGSLIQTIERPGGYTRNGQRFGQRIAHSGDYLAIRESNNFDGSSWSGGDVHMYKWNGSSYVFKQTLVPSNNGTGTLAIWDNSLAIGDNLSPRSVIFYTTSDDGETWDLEGSVTGQTHGGVTFDDWFINFASFGWGDYFATIDPRFTPAGDAITEQGAILVFKRTNGVWAYQSHTVISPGVRSEPSKSLLSQSFDGTYCVPASSKVSKAWVYEWDSVNETFVLDIELDLTESGNGNAPGVSAALWSGTVGIYNGTIAIGNPYGYRTSLGEDGYEGVIMLMQKVDGVWTHVKQLSSGNGTFNGVMGGTGGAYLGIGETLIAARVGNSTSSGISRIVFKA